MEKIFCPNCLKVVSRVQRPYVCSCTKAVLSTRNEWMLPKPKKRLSDFQGDPQQRHLQNQQRKEDRGRLLWKELHLHTACDRDWYRAWRSKIVNDKCGCGKHFQDLEKSSPIDFADPVLFFESSIAMHNAVNERLGKPIVSMAEAYALWRHRRPNTNRTRCIVTVAVGIEAQGILALTRPFMQRYSEFCDADLICLTNKTQDWWGLEKFRTYYFAQQYDQCLFLDADVVVKPNAPNIFDRYSYVALHDDTKYLPTLDWLVKERRQVKALSGCDLLESSVCWNSGVIYTRTQAADVWLPPEVAIGTSHCAEQIWVQHQAEKHDVELLDSRWNWCAFFKEFESGINDAWFVHFANAHPKLERIRRFVDRL